MVFLVMGNGAVEETLTRSLPARLRELLPSTWVVSVEGASNSPADATVRLTGPRGITATLDVKVKRWTTAPSSAVTGVLAREQARTLNPLLLVTDYTNRALREACQELGIGYIDELGWALITIDEPAILIRTEGTDRRAPKRANEVTRLNGVAVGRIVRTLLETRPPIGVRDLAKRSLVKSPGSVSKLLPTLEAANAIERDPSGQIVEVRRRALLKRWTQDYSFLNGNRMIMDYLAPRGLDSVLERLTKLSGVCVTGAFAGNDYLSDQIVPVVPATRLSLYAMDPSQLATELGLVEMDRASSNVLVAAPRDPELVESPQRRRSNLPLAPFSQVLADLVTLPGRESLLADQIMDQLAQTDQMWSH
jgi:DNA-binding transcriptional ArsR family regulator